MTCFKCLFVLCIATVPFLNAGTIDRSLSVNVFGPRDSRNRAINETLTTPGDPRMPRMGRATITISVGGDGSSGGIYGASAYVNANSNSCGCGISSLFAGGMMCFRTFNLTDFELGVPFTIALTATARTGLYGDAAANAAISLTLYEMFDGSLVPITPYVPATSQTRNRRARAFCSSG